MIRPLSQVLSYRNDEVVHRFSEDFSVGFSDSQEIFTETKRWLWLCACQRQDARAENPAPPSLPLLSEAYAVDQMWHAFLLFTKDYAAFCEEYFGSFIHHTPQTRDEKESWRRKAEQDPRLAIQERRKALRPAYEYIYDKLGAEVLKRWCEEFPDRFKFK